MQQDTFGQGELITHNDIQYMVTNDATSNRYVPVVCMQKEMLGAISHLPIDECRLSHGSVEVVNYSPLPWSISDVDSEVISQLEENGMLTEMKLLQELNGKEFFLTQKLQSMMNIYDEDGDNNGVSFFDEQETLFTDVIKDMLKCDTVNITDACETGASIYFENKKWGVSGYVGVDFNG